ncbi:MAG: CHAT domain-containing protein, partial [Rhodothermia bacterium]|nr:CHAT domain-containing protein [Rhodothermia bacterium]
DSQNRKPEDVARVYLEISRLHSRRHNFSMSAVYLDSVIAVVRSGSLHDSNSSYLLMQALHRRGRMLAKGASLDSTTRAIHLYERAVGEWNRHQSHPTFDQSNTNMFEHGAALLADAFVAATKIFRSTSATVDHDRLFRFSDMSKHYSARRVRFGDDLLAAVPDSVLVRRNALRARIKELELSQYPRPDSLQISNELFQARRDYDRFLLYLSQTYPAYYEFQHPNASLSASEIAASLDENEALIEFFQTRDSVYVIAISKEARSVHTVATDLIGQSVTMYLEAMRKRTARDYLQSSYKLYQELLQPIEDLIAEKNLTIVPDGQLHFVPFEPLLTSPVDISDGRSVRYQSLPYLIVSNSIEYAYSASLREFVRGREYPEWKSDFLGVAPAFKEVTFSWPQVPMDKVNYLPGTVLEVQSIYSMFVPWFDVLNRTWRTRSTALIGSNATEEKLRSLDLSQYRFLHFATHGSVAEENPAISGLLLHPGSRSHDDVLRLGEIYGMRLSADLVVLSACDTGLGRLVDGEGVIGLTGGFLYAGARNVVVSLWQVEDKSAAELMRRFYASSLRSNGFRESLRQAKIAIINSGGDFSRPYHWAGYVLFGS